MCSSDLMPEGSIVISGFNPLSLWGMKRLLWGRRDQLPWSGRFIGLLRLRDWLHLLGFELNGGRFGCYAPPFASSRWMERSGFMEKAGDRWCLCAPRWQEAFEAGQAPHVVLRATHEGALKYCALADLKKFAVDLS